ncbi:TIGR00366 family protein [Brevibacillus humidisoli]|uniref:short-chain fatty acid transporter n=1 Tax=Brevibacillus humidisoli TaxID=2895522 RepID=UPI001E4CAFCD|nr:TIGR00366 family protein [Brevibacillus humidisoli]UFJ42621.1 TIGR00366 family protein [Brevibacillus humidisoli]
MLHRVVNRFKFGVEKYLPDAFVFAIVLTLIVYLVGILVAGKGPFEMIEYWYGGFWSFLSFSMQMVVILVAGYCLALAPAVQKLVQRLAQIPRSPTAAVLSTVIVSAVAAYLSWGLGLVLGPIFARELSRNLRTVDYRVLIASAFCGAMAMLPASLSITAPLLVNTPGHFLEEQIGLISLEQTIFSPMLLVPSILVTLFFAFLFPAMHPKPEETIPFVQNEEKRKETSVDESAAAAAPTFADRMDNNSILSYLIVAGGLAWIIYHFATKGLDLNINFMNFLLIIVGLALHGSPRNYIKAIEKAIPASAGVVLQFPFYAGIMGMMASAGLITMISNWFSSISTTGTLPLFTYWSACLVNLFVPSAGGQWAVQGPVMVEAAKTIGVDPATVVNAVTMGDVTTNLFQPFWALPALGVAGLGIRDIWGYCLLAGIIYILIGSLGFWLLV